MNFAESIEYLYNLGNEVLAMKLGLENIGKLLDALGNPQNSYLKVQVAGTNGKGSVCAFLEAICIAAGINVGMTTSPHLVSVTERVKTNGSEISETDFARHATRVRNVSEKLTKIGELETVPTYFEQVTAIALNAFAEAQVELAILETGLGGRFDATTAANAEIVAVTPIDYDHQNILGNTLTEIAAEKAAIFRRGIELILSEQTAEAKKVIDKTCAKFEIKPKLTNFKSKIVDSKNGKLIVNFETGTAKYENVLLNLPGKHQIENAKAAVLLAETLNEKGFQITKSSIIEGLQTAIHKGRLEFYENFLFDGAHNISGAKALREYLDEFISQPIVMIFGSMRDKDLSEIAGILFPKADRLILTKPENQRAMETSELIKFVPKIFEKENLIIAETVAESIKKAREISSENHLILFTGSLYLIGEAQKILKNQFGI